MDAHQYSSLQSWKFPNCVGSLNQAELSNYRCVTDRQSGLRLELSFWMKAKLESFLDSSVEQIQPQPRWLLAMKPHSLKEIFRSVRAVILSSHSTEIHKHPVFCLFSFRIKTKAVVALFPPNKCKSKLKGTTWLRWRIQWTINQSKLYSYYTFHSMKEKETRPASWVFDRRK